MDDVAYIQKTEKASAGEDLASWDMALIVFDLIRDEFADLHVTEVTPVAPAKPAKKAKSTQP